MNKLKKLIRENAKATKHWFQSCPAMPRRDDADVIRFVASMTFNARRSKVRLHAQPKFPKGEL